MIESLPILLPVLFLGSIFCTVAGAGLGIIAIILLTFFIDIRTSVVIMSLIGFVIQPVKFFHFYKYARWDIVRWYLILGAPLSFAGGLLFFEIPMRGIEILVALFCFIFVLLRLSPCGFSIRPTRRNVILCGGLNGLQSGMVGEGTLLRSPFLLSMGLVKESFLGTSSVVALVTNTGKVAAYFPNILWTKELAIVLLSSIPLIILGVRAGKKLMPYVSIHLFENLLLLVISAGAIKLVLFP